MITGGPLKPHEYVVIRRTITGEDEAEIQNHTAKIGGSKKNPQIKLTLGDVKLALVAQMVEDWQLTETIEGPNGEEREVAIPYSPLAVKKLDRRILRYIEKKINEFNPDDEEDDEAFLPDAPGSSGEISDETKNLPPSF
jgi:hypothetical protein